MVMTNRLFVLNCFNLVATHLYIQHMIQKFCLPVILCSVVLVCRAQVQVSKEPRHHNVFENAHVRLLDVHIPAGDTSQIHIHSTPSVFLILDQVRTGSQVFIEEDHSKSPVKNYGNIWFEGFYLQPRIHRVWNSDTSEFHVMDIELPNKNYITIDPPVQRDGFIFLFDEKPVRAYRLKLIPSQTINLSSRKADILMIRLTDLSGPVQTNETVYRERITNGRVLGKKGDFVYYRSGNPIEIKNDGDSTVEFAFFELK
jgi:hypothetical protein